MGVKEKPVDKGKSSHTRWRWDNWQREVLEHDGNITIRSGRQVGKSVVVAEKAVRFALGHDNSSTLILAASQRQASLLFEKVRGTLALREVDPFDGEPTLSKLTLKNGSRIYCLPAGKTGAFIRGYTIDLLIIDEAAYVPEVVFNAIIPMIAVSRKKGLGYIILLSTPFGKGGYFYHSFGDPDFRQWHVSSEKCPRIPGKLLTKERKRLSKAQYLQEWCGEFAEEYNQFFKSDLLQRQMTFIEWSMEDKWAGSSFYLGIDVARYGGDENAFVVVELHRNGLNLRAVQCHVTDMVSTVDTIGKAMYLDEVFGFKKIFIDDAGVGGAVTDVLEEKLGRRVMGLNNASKRVEVQGEEKKKGILKEDLYSNCLVLLENHKLELLSDSRLLTSMKSITFQYTTDVQNRVKIFGNYSHLTEALVRACWCVKERGLDIYLY